MEYPGRNWYSIDFHVHSPASHDYRGDKDISPSEFLDSFIERGIRLICLTDHSTSQWADEVRNASRKKPITVFPGFEVTINGIHFTAIFPEKTDSNHLHELLVKVGIGENQRGKKESVCNQDTTPKSFSETVHASGGLVIAAHCLSKTDGLMGHQKVLGRAMFDNFLPFIDVLEIKPQQSSERIEQYWTSINGQYRGRKLPIVIGSDSHSPDEITDPSCFVSLSSPSFRSLRQILIEPKHRVSLLPVKQPTYPRIIRITTTSQKLSGIDTAFSPHLNTIIGGRGSGKSATIDLLRWTLDDMPSHGATRDSITTRIEGFLGENFSAAVEYALDGNKYRATRTGKAQPPFIEQWVSNEWIPAPNSQPIAVDFYSQGEASRLSDVGSEPAQLALIDSLGDTKGIKESISDILEDLDHNAIEIQALFSDLAQREALEQRLERLRNDSRKWTSILKSDAFKNHRTWNAADKWVKYSIEKIKVPDRILVGPLALLPAISKDYPEKPTLEALNRVHLSMKQAVESSEERLQMELASLISEVPAIYAQWVDAYQAARTQYEQELQEMEGADVANQDVLNSQLSSAENEIKEIGDRLASLDKMSEKLNILQQQRNLLLNTLEDTRRALCDERARISEKLSNEVASLTIEIEHAADKSSVEQFLRGVLRGSNIHSQDSVVGSIAQSGSPREIADLVRSKEVRDLSQSFGITTVASQKLKTALDPSKLLEFETLGCNDVPTIMLRKGDEGDHEPLKRLSAGQRCSAILAIALMDHEKPLVIDQPEDELDHKYIVEEIVETIRRAKNSRQLIMATHNPNIPVLGDAEFVIKVEEHDGVCHIETSGGLEEPNIIAKVQDLDGGRDAFERRRARYGDDYLSIG